MDDWRTHRTVGLTCAMSTFEGGDDFLEMVQSGAGLF